MKLCSVCLIISLLWLYCTTVSTKCLYKVFYSWHFYHYSMPIHWLVHGHMTSDNETVYHQMSNVGNMVTWCQTGNSSPKCWLLLHVIRACSWRCLMLSLEFEQFFKICLCFVLLYNKSLNDWSLGEQWILFPLNLYNVSQDKQNSLFHLGPDMSLHVNVKCMTRHVFETWVPTNNNLHC